jgi:hypothetical protein
MAKFFVPVIFLLTIAWLIVGLQNEFESPENNTLNTDSVTQNYMEKIVDNISFRVPNQFSITTVLSYGSDAILQLYRTNPFIGLIVYSDIISNDSTAFNYSVKNYIQSEINALNPGTMLDSTRIELNNGATGVLIKCNYIVNNDTYVANFLTFENNRKLYMFFVYYHQEDEENCKSTVDSILNSIRL